MLIGTEKGLYEIETGAKASGEPRVVLPDQKIVAFASQGGMLWVIADERSLLRQRGTKREEVATLPHEGACLLPAGSGVLIGTEDAHVYRFEGGKLSLVGGFDALPTRSTWYTPWGGPPAVRSMSGGRAILANVHVGGVVRSRDGGARWEQTPLDIDSDVHEVLALDKRVLCAAAVGLAESLDGGETWEIHTDGLHAEYCRAVAVDARTLYLSASQSHTGKRAALYRAPLDLSEPFERCREGLPEWFDDNVDSGCIATARGIVAIGTTDGSVYVSRDRGDTWSELASGLPSITQVAAA